MFKALCVFVLFVFTGCSFLGIRTPEDRKRIAQEEVKEFSRLLNEGWDIKVHEGRVILVKDTEEGFQIKDIFEE